MNRPQVIPYAQGIRSLTEADVEFTITAEEEDTPIKGSFSSGDDAADAELEKSIRDDYNAGNEWAWCCVKVTGTWVPTEDVSLVASAYLGACSYKSQRDFIECNDYCKDLKAEVLDELNKKLSACAEAIECLREPQS